jgi:hypothetical protein
LSQSSFCRTPLKNTSVMWVSWINMKIIIIIILFP